MSDASFRLGKKSVGADQPVFVIAEAGVNHNGDLALAKRLVEEAARAGADCVKFQTFHAEDLVIPSAPKASYQLLSSDPGESQLSMLEKLELSEDSFRELKTYCDRVGILFLSTPYGFRDVDVLERLGVEAYKVASGQMTEHPFLNYVARKGKPMIVSTGMATLEDVAGAVQMIRRTGLKDLVMLQCTTNYPSAIEDCHLRAMQSMRDELDVPIGYSDHTTSPLAILGAVAAGASVIEKHFTLDRTMPGPDHGCSIEPSELSKLIQDIRTIEKMLGSAQKRPSAAEVRNAMGMKRSLVSSRFIPKGAEISADDILFKRPATGIPPNDLAKVLGAKVRSDIPADTLLHYEMFESTVGLDEVRS